MKVRLITYLTNTGGIRSHWAATRNIKYGAKWEIAVGHTRREAIRNLKRGRLVEFGGLPSYYREAYPLTVAPGGQPDWGTRGSTKLRSRRRP